MRSPRTRYEHINHNWRRATAERRADLIGELQLLFLQLPAHGPQATDRPVRRRLTRSSGCVCVNR